MSVRHDGPDRREQESWHLSKQVQLSHIFSTIAALAAAVLFGANLVQRVALLEQTNVNYTAAKVLEKEQDLRDQAAMVASRREIIERLEKLTDKVDKVLIAQSQKR